ncbi:Zn-dependent peptidase ImmA (M78 family) [Cytobacillus horneckiae]|uniref:ImmA/IrrE family metallo-endopeptidase n=1 Tax=Cytobacillus horneckiae TaxID=549687 RepID=UPI0019CF8C2F|nr:ImmA/IrrE family metallo-endopeptidase [Cytobacillus horneckiae]MBN6887776.1 ImmA/IrrE family metallo-endopeptidase [Cytobacillus horneckiae]
MKFQMTSLENNIGKLYNFLEIQTPEEIEMYKIAEKLDIWIHYWNKESKMNYRKGMYSIILDNRKNSVRQWQDFCHELAHVIRHYGNQNKMHELFIDLQESQATNFMYHFCVPTFMLLKLNINDYININNGVDFVVKTFNVTEDFANKRLIHFRNQMLQAKSDEEHRRYMEARYPKMVYSEETKDVLKELDLLIKKRKGVTT